MPDASGLSLHFGLATEGMDTRSMLILVFYFSRGMCHSSLVFPKDADLAAVAM